METNQTTQTFDTRQVATNKKMMNCKTCGVPMAKSAKKCPSCGAKNIRRKLKKILIFILIILILFCIRNIMNLFKKAEIDETYSTNGIEFTVESISFYRGEKTGISEIDDNICISIDGRFENKSKYDRTVDGSDFSVDFDNGYKFNSDYMYIGVSYTDAFGNEQKTFKLCEGGVLLKSLDSEIWEFKMLIPVADAVFENGDKSIKISVFDYTYNFDNVSDIKNSREDTINRLSEALGN